MSDILHDTQWRNSRLSDTFREDFQANPHGVEGGGEDFESWPDFNGHLSMTDTSVSVRIAGYRKMAAVWFGGVLEAHAKGWIRSLGEEAAPMACNPADGLDTAPPSGDGATALGAGWRKLGVIAPGYGHSVGRMIIAELNGDKRDDYLQVRDDGSVRTSLNTVGTPGFLTG
jgi:hypothetical protein